MREGGGRSGEALPFATIVETGGRCLIAAVNDAAAAAGIEPGRPLADARALLPGLAVAAADPAGDAAALDRLADWCGRYTPWTAVECADEGVGAGLWLDVTGCAHLFAGEAALLADLVGRLRAFGYAARAGLAGTPGAAWAAARFLAGNEQGLAVVAPGAERAALAPLPVAALRLPPADGESLARLGLRRVGDLLALPRPALSRRFGAALLRRLDQALGLLDEPLSPRQPVPPRRARLAFPEPIAAPEDLAAALHRLLGALCRGLAVAEEGARRIELSLFRIDGSVQRTGVGTSRASRDPAALERLLAPQIERLDPGFGVEVMVLAAPWVEPLSALQLALAAPAPGSTPVQAPSPPTPEEDHGVAAGAPDALAGLLDRLGGRLGLDSIHRFVPRDSHLPERAVERVPPFDGRPPAGWPDTAPRPVRLLRYPEPVEALSPFALLQAPEAAGPAAPLPLPPPTRSREVVRTAGAPGGATAPFATPAPEEPAMPAAFRWRGRVHRVRRAEGPERIAPEWWRPPAGRGPGGWDPGRVRDYWRVEDAEGRRFWLYREVPAPAVPHPGRACSAPLGMSGMTLVRKGARGEEADEAAARPLTPALSPACAGAREPAAPSPEIPSPRLPHETPSPRLRQEKPSPRLRGEGWVRGVPPRWFLHGLFA